MRSVYVLDHHFVFSLKLIFFKDFACSTASIVIKHAYFVGKNDLCLPKNCVWTNWKCLQLCKLMFLCQILMDHNYRSDTMVNTIFDGIWFWAVIETGDCSAQYTMALSRWPWDNFFKRSKIFLIVQQERLFF